MNKPSSDREAQVLQIILKVLRERLDPPRIILFGSRAEGRARKESDFDVGVEGPVPEFRTRWQIAEAVEDAIGLYEVDIVYLNALEPSFRELILKTGKTVYEREEKEALRKYENALSRLTEALTQPASILQADAVIQRFEFTFELLWKTQKIYLEDIGIETKSPKETLKAAFKQGWIADEALVLDMLEDRNRTSHLYDEPEAAIIFERIRQSYLGIFQTMLVQLQTK